MVGRRLSFVHTFSTINRPLASLPAVAAMAGMMPQSVQQVEKAVESMMQDIHRDLLQPKQKEAFLCCARCCDTSDGMQQLQNCVERCSQGSARTQKLIHSHIQELQERLQRCASRCQDLARDGLSFDPSPREQEKAQDRFSSCMDDCGKECLDRIPKLKADLMAQLRKM